MDEIFDIAKQSLGIVEDSTLKDKEIEMLVNEAATDMKRHGINVDDNLEDFLIIGTIVLFVKSKFGMTEVSEKKLAQNGYEKNCNNLALSSDYKIVEEENND